MDPTIIAALIGGLSSILASVLVELIKIWSANRVTKTKSRKKKNAGEEKAENGSPSRPRKLADIPFWPRAGIIFAPVMLILGFLYSTGIISWKVGDLGNDPCPGRHNIQNAQDLEIKIPTDSIAYFMGWEFDGEDGGYFITFNGPYRRTHTFNNGIYCPSIPKNSALSQKTVNFLMEGCGASQGGCAQEQVCSQNILEYFSEGGKCHE